MKMYHHACNEIDTVHKQDKTIEMFDGVECPAELLYAQRLVSCLDNLIPEAPDHLKLAARCQHFKRWEIARDTYPMDKVGYLKWRKFLYVYQSDQAAKILENVGYDNDFIQKVKMLIQKKEINKNPETQVIEDIACLVFLEFYLKDFSAKHDTEKLKSIIAKTWAKMSEHAKKVALQINFTKELESIILEAVKA